MKATDFNVNNIKEKYNFKSSNDFLTFLKKQLKMKEQDKKEAQKLLDFLDFNCCDSEIEQYPDDFKEFIHNARKGILKRLDRANVGIQAIKQDIEIVKSQCNN